MILLVDALSEEHNIIDTQAISTGGQVSSSATTPQDNIYLELSFCQSRIRTWFDGYPDNSPVRVITGCWRHKKWCIVLWIHESQSVWEASLSLKCCLANFESAWGELVLYWTLMASEYECFHHLTSEGPGWSSRLTRHSPA